MVITCLNRRCLKRADYIGRAGSVSGTPRLVEQSGKMLNFIHKKISDNIDQRYHAK